MHDSELTTRLEEMERELQRVSAALDGSRTRVRVGVTVAAAMLIGWACTTPPATDLRVTSIEIVDQTGEVAIRLAAPAIELIREDTTRAKIAVSGSGPEFTLHGPDGTERATFGLVGSEPVLLMGNVQSEPELQLAVARTGSGLWLRDRTGNTQVDLSITPQGTQLVLRDEDSETTYAPGAAAE